MGEAAGIFLNVSTYIDMMIGQGGNAAIKDER
jgi:hypothetical protein